MPIVVQSMHCRDNCDMSCLRVGLNMFDMASDGEPAAIIAEPIVSAGVE